MTAIRRPHTISFDSALLSHTDTLEYSSSITGGFHQVHDFNLPILRRKPSTLILTPKADGKLQWEFPPGSDVATTALDLTPIECNAYSPPVTPDDWDTKKPKIHRWESCASPLMMPKIERRPSFDPTNLQSISPNNTKHHLRTKHMSRSKTPSRPEFHSYRHLSRSYGVLSKSKSVTFPINYSAPENVVGLSKALELSPIKLMGRAETTTPVLSVELGSELRLRIPRARRLEPSWKLLYSIDQHGVSIHTMYENLRNHQGPIILAIKDSEDTTFGAYLSEPFQPHPGFYGNGECFLWKRVNSDMIEAEVKVYPRSGENEYYMLSDLGFISVGSSDGKFGLWLNNQFDEGVTNKCTTFDNDPLTTSKFHCVEMEIWGI